MLQERAYQDDMIREARVKLRAIRERLKAAGETRGPRLLIQAATGAGKTMIAAKITKAAIGNNARVFFNCHRDFLVSQTAGTFKRLDIPHSFIAAGVRTNWWEPVHINMIPSLRSRRDKLPENFAPTICLWDEGHHIGAKTWAELMLAWPDATHIALSATPVRLDGKGLDTWFDDIVLGPPVHWLIASGYLSDYRAYAPSSPDLTGLHTRMGDYVTDEIDEVMDKAVIIGDMVRDYKQYAAGRRAVYFCVSIKHSQHVAASFNAAGIPAMHLDGTHKTWEREQAAKAFARDDLMVLTNVDLFGEGYDLAAQAGMDVTIDCVGLARPTQSLGLLMQQVGRALRPKPYPAIILDHAGNLMKHGLPDDEIEWSLKGAKKKDASQGGGARQCEECFAMIPAFKRVCPHCGAGKKATGGPGRAVDEKDGDLHEIDKDAIRKAKKLEEWQAGTLQELIEIGERRGYKDAEKWAGYIWTSKQAKNEAREYARKQQMDFFANAMVERYGQG